MIRSIINGEIIKGEVYTKIDIDKIVIRFIKIGELNFNPVKGEKISFGFQTNKTNVEIYDNIEISSINKNNIEIYKSIEISLIVSEPFSAWPLRDVDELISNTDWDIEENEGYKGELINIYLLIPKES